jgi:hypothetical protein
MKLLQNSLILLFTVFSISCGNTHEQNEIDSSSIVKEDSSINKIDSDEKNDLVSAKPVIRLLPKKFNGEYTDECELDSYNSIKIKNKSDISSISVDLDNVSIRYCELDSIQENGKSYTCYFKEKDKLVVLELTYLDKGVLKAKLLEPSTKRKSINLFKCLEASDESKQKYFN